MYKKSTLAKIRALSYGYHMDILRLSYGKGWALARLALGAGTTSNEDTTFSSAKIQHFCEKNKFY